MKLALTGATGLVGSRFFDLLKSKYEIIPISSAFGVNITEKDKISRFLDKKNPALIVHLAAKTNVDKCEQDMNGDIKKLEKEKVYKDGEFDLDNLDEGKWKDSPSAFGVNVVGTKNLADWALAHDVKIIYMSTDFIFDGEKSDGYSEDDVSSPINWYGRTKFWGEKALREESLITRISYPYGYRSTLKKDMVWTLVDILATLENPRLVFDQIITPTFLDDIVNGVDFLIENKVSGIINLTGSNFLSPYEIGVAIAREFNLNEGKIQTVKRSELYKGCAKRPFKAMMKNDKIKNLGFKVTDFFEALSKIRVNL